MWQTPKLDWTADDYYNAEDLNRVESNTQEVAELIKELLGIDINLEAPVTNRDYSSIEFADSLNRVERNLEKLSVLNLDGLKALKTSWQAGDSFSYKDAVRLENNLSVLYNILSKNTNNIFYCGNLNCGEEAV